MNAKTPLTSNNIPRATLSPETVATQGRVTPMNERPTPRNTRTPITWPELRLTLNFTYREELAITAETTRLKQQQAKHEHTEPSTPQ